MPHHLNITDNIIREIEILLPRLRYAVRPSQVIKWLENFKSNEVLPMLNLLAVFEYITYEEFIFRMDNLLKQILDQIPKQDEILIMPIEKFGKSGVFVTYPLAKTSSYKKRNKKLEISNDVKDLKSANVKHIIFVDDFIGTGHTFVEWYDKQIDLIDFIVKQQIYSLHVLSCVAMKEALEYIHKKNLITVVADIRNKIFCNKSALQIYNKSVCSRIQYITNTYGKSFRYEYNGIKLKNSYGESQALIAFFHSTPNNSLSIIWNDRQWNPLFPRRAVKRLSEIADLRKDISYHLHICNKLKVNIQLSLQNYGKLVKDDEDEKNSNRFDHLIILFLFLKKKGFDDIVISQILSLSAFDIIELYTTATSIAVIDSKKQLTVIGNNFVKNIAKARSKYDIRAGKKRTLHIREQIVYLPTMLNGTT